MSTYSFTILKPSGREMLSCIDRSYAETDSLIVEKAELTQPGGKPVPLDQSQIDTRTAPNPDQGFLREPDLLAFPNLRVGTRISYTLRRHFTAKPLSTQFHYILSRPPMPVRDDRFVAEFKVERPIFVRSELMDAYRIEQSADKKTLKVSLKSRNTPTTSTKPATPTCAIPRAWSWAVRWTCRTTSARSPRATTRSSPRELPKGAAAAVAAVRKPAREQVAGLMQYINDTYRYLGDWRASERGYVPFSLAEIERNGYGDCKDLAILPRRHAQGRRDQGRTDPGQPRRRGLGPAGARHVRAEPCHRPRRGGRQDLVAGPDQPGVRSRPHHARHPAALGAGAGRRRQGAARRDSPGSAGDTPARDPQRALHP